MTATPPMIAQGTRAAAIAAASAASAASRFPSTPERFRRGPGTRSDPGPTLPYPRDLVFGQHIPALFNRYAKKPGNAAAMMHAPEIPAQRLVIDFLLHPDVWGGRDPELTFYNTSVRGVALPNDRTRDTDRVDLLDSVRRIGSGIDCCRIAEMPGKTTLENTGAQKLAAIHSYQHPDHDTGPDWKPRSEPD